MPEAAYGESRSSSISWMLATIAVPIIFFILGLATIYDFPETTDECFDRDIGSYYYWEWSTQGFDGLITRFYQLKRNYGPLFDIIVIASGEFFHGRLGLLKTVLAAQHLPVLLVSTAALCCVAVFVGCICGWRVSLVSTLVLALMPQFIGNSQNNLKDMPLLTFFAFGVALVFFAVRKQSYVLSAISGIVIGLAYCIRVHALMIPVVCILWFLYDSGVNLKKLLSSLALWLMMTAAAVPTVLLCWPYYRTEPVARFFETIQAFSQHTWNGSVLYMGEHLLGSQLPWHFQIVQFCVTTPIFFLLLGAIGILFSIAHMVRRDALGSFSCLLFLWLLVPPLGQILSGAPFYDGVRHVLLVLVPFSIFAGIGAVSLMDLSLSLRTGRVVAPVCIVGILLGFASVLRDVIVIHPYQAVYFNSLVGGVKGAYGKFDLDYWGLSLRDAAAWINRHAVKGTVVSFPLPENFHRQVEFDLSKIRLTYRTDQFPDYKIHLIRGMMRDVDPTDDYLRPKDSPCHTVSVQGAPVLNIFCYPLNREIRESAPLVPQR